MIFILSKILLFLIKPIVWVLVLLIFALFSKVERKRKKFLLLAIITFFIFSNEFLLNKIMDVYEADCPAKQNYDVGIVLGGFSNINKKNNKIEFNWAADRLFQTIALYKEGMIRKILISGGSANFIDTEIKEADLVGAYLKKIGIPDSAILLENQSRNTIENAKNSLKVIEKYIRGARILVISSAWHIPRVKLIFNRYSKNKIDFYPTNFISKSEYDLGDFLIPQTSVLGHWELLFKEWIGLIVDKFRK